MPALTHCNTTSRSFLQVVFSPFSPLCIRVNREHQQVTPASNMSTNHDHVLYILDVCADEPSFSGHQEGAESSAWAAPMHGHDSESSGTAHDNHAGPSHLSETVVSEVPETSTAHKVTIMLRPSASCLKHVMQIEAGLLCCCSTAL